MIDYKGGNLIHVSTESGKPISYYFIHYQKKKKTVKAITEDESKLTSVLICVIICA